MDRRTALKVIAGMAVTAAGCGSDEPGSCESDRVYDDLEGRCVDNPFDHLDSSEFPIIFSRKQEGTSARLIVASIDGRQEQQFVTGQESAQTPSWSPDGRMIAFTNSNGLYVADRNGVRRVVDTETTFQEINGRPTWYGDKIVFEGYNYANPELRDGIFIVNVDGSGLQKIMGPTGSYHWHLSPSTSDHGDIAYVFYLASGDLPTTEWNYSVHITSAVTGEDYAVPNTVYRGIIDDLVLSPDGQRIAVGKAKDGGDGPRESFIIDRDGGNKRLLRLPEDRFPLVSGMVFSPDKRTLLFSATNPSDGVYTGGQLYTYDLSTDTVTRFIRSEGRDYAPDWK